MRTNVNDDIAARPVLEAALELFVDKGFADTKMDDIADQAGVTKRQLTYHFGDKTNLYREAIRYGLERLHPSTEELRATSEIPVEAMRHVLSRVFDAYFDSPNSVRLVTAENLHPLLPRGEYSRFFEQHPAVQEYDRILLLGRDLGAFRTDVSATDIHFIVASMCCFPTLGDPAFHGIYALPLTDEAMREKTKALVIDTIIGFLTSVNGGSGGESYTGADNTPNDPVVEVHLSDEVYGDDETRLYDASLGYSDIYEQ